MASFLDTVFGGGAQEDAAAKNAAALSQYGTTAGGALSQGYTTGQGYLGQATGAFQPLSSIASNYNKAGNLYLGALGAGGPQGTAAAQAAFQNAPGYQGAVTAGTDAIQRQMAAAGMENTGNTAENVGTYVQNLQNQQYNTWLQNLQNAGQTGVNATQQAAAGTAQALTNQGQLGYTYGTDQGSIAGNIASGTMADNNMVAAGQAAGAKNLLGAGLSLATLGMGGGMGGAGGGLGSLLGGAMGGVSGGTAAAPLPGLTASDYGTGSNAGGFMAQYGLAA